MARLDHIDSYQHDLFTFMFNNMPSEPGGVSLMNADISPAREMLPPYLHQSTVEIDRVNSSAGGLTSRTRFIHTIQVLVDKDNLEAKKSIGGIVKHIVGLFENKYLDGLYCLEASPEKVGDEPNTNLYRYDININGYFEGN